MKKTGFKSEPIIKKSQTFDNLQEPLYPALDQSSDYHLALAKVLSENKSSHISKSELLGPLGPVQMGDMVYLPAYKVLDHQQQVLNKNKLIEHENTVLKQFLQNNTKLMHQMSLLQAMKNSSCTTINLLTDIEETQSQPQLESKTMLEEVKQKIKTTF